MNIVEGILGSLSVFYWDIMGRKAHFPNCTVVVKFLKLRSVVGEMFKRDPGCKKVVRIKELLWIVP